MEVQSGGPASTHAQGAGGEGGTGGKPAGVAGPYRGRRLPKNCDDRRGSRAQDANIAPDEWLQDLVRKCIDTARRARTKPVL